MEQVMTLADILEDIASHENDVKCWHELIASLPEERRKLDEHEALLRGWIDADNRKIEELKKKLEMEHGIRQSGS
jgi:uncharacterized protein (UPF0335 family)